MIQAGKKGKMDMEIKKQLDEAFNKIKRYSDKGIVYADEKAEKLKELIKGVDIIKVGSYDSGIVDFNVSEIEGFAKVVNNHALKEVFESRDDIETHLWYSVLSGDEDSQDYKKRKLFNEYLEAIVDKKRAYALEYIAFDETTCVTRIEIKSDFEIINRLKDWYTKNVIENNKKLGAKKDPFFWL